MVRRLLPDHHDIVEKGTHNATNNLSSESGFGRELVLLGELQVTKEEGALAESVVGVRSKVHVG
jgi:hypothetical protein